MEITVYSHHPGMCNDGGQIFKPTTNTPVCDTIERVMALLSLRQDIRILAVAVSENGEVHVYNIRISPHIKLDEQYAFQCIKDFNRAESYTYNPDEVMHKLEVIFNDLVLYDFNATGKTSVFS